MSCQGALPSILGLRAGHTQRSRGSATHRRCGLWPRQPQARRDAAPPRWGGRAGARPSRPDSIFGRAGRCPGRTGHHGGRPSPKFSGLRADHLRPRDRATSRCRGIQKRCAPSARTFCLLFVLTQLLFAVGSRQNMVGIRTHVRTSYLRVARRINAVSGAIRINGALRLFLDVVGSTAKSGN